MLACYGRSGTSGVAPIALWGVFASPDHVMGVCCAAWVGVAWPPVVASFLRRPSSFESHSPCAVADRPARKNPKAAGLQAKQLKPHWGSGSQLPTSGSASLRQIHRFVALGSQAKKSLSGSAENTPARHLLGGTIFERVSESETLPNTPATPPNKNTNRNDLGASNLYKRGMRTFLRLF